MANTMTTTMVATMTNPTIPNTAIPASTASRPRSAQTGAAQTRPVPIKRDTSISWKSIILSAGVGVTLLGSTLLTRVEQANAAAETARTTQASAVVQVVQALEFAQSTRTAQMAAQASSANQPRTLIVRVPVSVSGGQTVANQGGGDFSGQSNNQQAAQPSQASFASAPAPAITMPAMPVAPVFRAPVAVTKAS